MNETPDALAINTIRMLAVDAIQQAKSGHPCTPTHSANTTMKSAIKSHALGLKNVA